MPQYRSRLEEKLARWFELNGHQFEYETLKLNFTLSAVYTPDFILPNGVILEAKGYFKPEEAAPSQFAFYMEVAAHQLHQLAADRQAQTRPFDPAGYLGCLFKG